MGGPRPEVAGLVGRIIEVCGGDPHTQAACAAQRAEEERRLQRRGAFVAKKCAELEARGLPATAASGFVKQEYAANSGGVPCKVQRAEPKKSARPVPPWPFEVSSAPHVACHMLVRGNA